MIEFQNVTKAFGSGATQVTAVNGLSFRCPQGSFYSLTGPSGSGKSTVLHLIAGLTPPTSGTVVVEGVDIARMTAVESALMRRRRIGYVLQTFDLLPFLSARANVAMPLVLDGIPRREIDARVREALEVVNMLGRAEHDPTELSGGEQQRVAVARALVIRPAILLADEPTGNLDRTAGRAIMDLFRDVNSRTGVTILLVTHDQVFASYGQRILHLVDGALDQDIVLEERSVMQGRSGLN
jgi:putative ABC transport system ATP-binding protein